MKPVDIEKAWRARQSETPFHIDYRTIRDALDELPVAIDNRIRREHHRRLVGLQKGLPALLKLTLKVSSNTWDTIRFLCREKLEHGRRLEFCISVPPLSRTLVDSLFTINYVFDNPAANARWFYASGWREESAHHQRLVAKHGTDQKWIAWLSHMADGVDGIAQDGDVTPAERADPTSIKWWPNPGAMVSKRPPADPIRSEFLRFLNDWFYRHLSGDSHLSYGGLARRGGHFAEGLESIDPAEVLTSYRTHVLLTSLSIYVALLSEISGELSLGHEMARLRVVWEHIKQWPEAKELFDGRYDNWLRA